MVLKKKLLFLFLLISSLLLLSSCGGEGDNSTALPDTANEPIATTEKAAEESTSSDTTDMLSAETSESASDTSSDINKEEPVLPIVSCSGLNYTYEEMVEDLVLLEERYGDILTLAMAGRSHDKRRIYAAMLGNVNAEKQILVTAGMHARESANCYMTMLQLEYYLSNYYAGEIDGVPYSDIFDKVSVVVMPMVNPDGIALSTEGLSAIRKSALESTVRYICSLYGVTGNEEIDIFLSTWWKSNAVGIDINRNFPTFWDAYYDTEGEGSYQNYKGEEPMSEPETQAIIKVLSALSDPVASLCIHSQGDCIYWQSKEKEDSDRNAVLAVLLQEYTSYYMKEEEDPTEPSFSNYTTVEYKIPTVTVENGLGGYPQKPEMAYEFLDRNLEIWAAVAANAVGN